jgi:hypothetical protein
MAGYNDEIEQRIKHPNDKVMEYVVGRDNQGKTDEPNPLSERWIRGK